EFPLGFEFACGPIVDFDTKERTDWKRPVQQRSNGWACGLAGNRSPPAVRRLCSSTSRTCMGLFVPRCRR
ncbi:MAG: hypothetical protein V7727_20495, partial [Sneathiella sp.]